MSDNGVPKEKIQNLYRTDRAVIFICILVMFGTLAFVLMNILPESPSGMIRMVMILTAFSVMALSTLALLRVLKHLGKHKEALYSEDITALERTGHSA